VSTHSANPQAGDLSDAASPPQTLAPAAQGERIGSLDFIRGIAVMGILAANIVAFGQPMVAYMYPAGFMVPNGDPEGWMWIAQFVLIDGKMRTLFTLLFGAGLYLFMERAWARGATRWLQVRRLAVLLLFGFAHFYLIWKGDILTLYAVWGIVALPFMRLSATAQMAIGVIVYILGGVLYSGLFGGMYFVSIMEPAGNAELIAAQDGFAAMKTTEIDKGAVEAALIQSGDYGGYVANNLTTHLTLPMVMWLQLSVETLPLILIGMAIYRMGFFDDSADRAAMLRWGWVGVIGGGLGSLGLALFNQSDGFSFIGTMWSFIGLSTFVRLPMALGLAALLVVYSPGWTGWLAQRVRAAGRAAFSNYLGTSIVMMLVFHGWALGLFGTLNRPQLYLVMVLAWGVMLAWSKPWLDRYRYGPLEWLWRCLTYGRLFPLRRESIPDPV
jgi:uncharacterized protein